MQPAEVYWEGQQTVFWGYRNTKQKCGNPPKKYIMFINFMKFYFDVFSNPFLVVHGIRLIPLWKQHSDHLIEVTWILGMKYLRTIGSAIQLPHLDLSNSTLTTKFNKTWSHCTCSLDSANNPKNIQSIFAPTTTFMGKLGIQTVTPTQRCLILENWEIDKLWFFCWKPVIFQKTVVLHYWCLHLYVVYVYYVFSYQSYSSRYFI